MMVKDSGSATARISAEKRQNISVADPINRQTTERHVFILDEIDEKTSEGKDDCFANRLHEKQFFLTYWSRQLCIMIFPTLSSNNLGRGISA